MFSLAEGEKRVLLRIARSAFNAAVQNRPTPEAGMAASFPYLGGAFVTLTRNGRLRGCIGQLPSGAPLVDVVSHCAYAAASDDPRFPRVMPEELQSIAIELSVLSELFEIEPQEIQVGTHGLFVANGSRRGVLLPQVALQFHWDGVRFLEATCEKAGLSRDAWKNDTTRVQAFTAEVFSEAEFQTS